MHRLTITLPDDLYAMARAKAIASRTSISKAIGDLLRRGRDAGHTVHPSGNGPLVHPLSGFPMIELEESITMDEIQRSMEDEDARHQETMGWSGQQIQHTPEP